MRKMLPLLTFASRLCRLAPAGELKLLDVTAMNRRTLSIAVGFTTLFCNAAFACSTVKPPPTDEDLFASAKSVFVAHLYRTEERMTDLGITGKPIPNVEGSFTVVEVLKGTPPSNGKVVDMVFGPGNCSLGLFAGLDYVFFIQDDKHNLVIWPTGSRAFINIEAADAVKAITALHKLSSQAAHQ